MTANLTQNDSRNLAKPTSNEIIAQLLEQQIRLQRSLLQVLVEKKVVTTDEVSNKTGELVFTELFDNYLRVIAE